MKTLISEILYPVGIEGEILDLSPYFFPDLPEVSSDQPVVHGGLGQLCELSCLVYADPEADVVWYRDTMRLDPNERR